MSDKDRRPPETSASAAPEFGSGGAESATLTSNPLAERVTPAPTGDGRGHTRLRRPHAEGGPWDERYELGESLGRGGMGEVLAARDRRIGREVAVKRLRDQQGSLSRFMREARIQGLLEHPAIVPVHDIGVAPDGLPYFTMKRVKGMTVAEILSAQRAGDADALRNVSRTRLLAALVTVGQAVDFAHSRGILHRDLKPSNIVLGDFGEVYVLDWGIACVRGEGESEARGEAQAVDDSCLTGTGAVLGTAGYAAPEQLSGAEDVDERADCYSLGALLFEILTLQPLHLREGRDREALISSTLRGQLDRPSERTPDRDIPAALDAICAKATALDRGDRYASVSALCTALQDFLTGESDLARRRELACDHARAASATAQAALAHGDLEARRRALSHASQAIALDLENREARETILKLLIQPPGRTPPEVEREVDARIMQASQLVARLGAVMHALIISYVVFALWLGLRSIWLCLFVVGAASASAAHAWWFSRIAKPRASMLLHAAALNSLIVAAATSAFGPLVVAPGLAAVTAIAFMLHGRVHAVAAVALLTAGFVAPTVLQWIGLLPPSYRFEDGALWIMPRLHDFPPIPSMITLLAVNVLLLVSPAMLVRRLRLQLVDSERKLLVQSWQLRQAQAPPPPAGAAAVSEDRGG